MPKIIHSERYSPMQQSPKLWPLFWSDGAWLRAGTAWSALFITTIALSVMFGVSINEAIRYAIYQSFFVVLPGTVLLVAAAKRKLRPIEFLAKVIIVGQCFEMIAGLCVTALSAKSAYPLFPILYILAAAIMRRRIFSILRPSSERVTVEIAGFAVAVFLVFAGSLFNFDPIVDQHFTWVAAFAQAVSNAWPPTEPFLMNVPLHYHYLYNVHVGMAAYTMGIPVIVVASRTAIIFQSLSLIVCLFSFASERFHKGSVGVVAAVSLLLTFGYSNIMWKVFHFATASIMYRVASTIVAFQIFLILLDEILTSRIKRLSFWLICLLAFVASGTRANMLPMLAAGVSMLLITNIRDRSARNDYAAVLLIIVAAIGLGSVIFLGAGTGHADGTKLILIHPLNLNVSTWSADEYSPLVTTLQGWGLPEWLVTLLYLCVALCGRTTFLLPGVICIYLGRTVADGNTKVLLGGVAIGGLLLLLLVQTVVPQEIWAFYWYADIALALLGALGLFELWRRRSTSRFAVASLILSAVLFFIQASEFVVGFVPKLATTRFPTPAPVFQSKSLHAVSLQLIKMVKPGDVLVTGGNFKEIDDRSFSAIVPGLQLYASRYILPIYASRTNIGPSVASRLWLLDNDLSSSVDRERVRADVGSARSLYLLWIGPLPPDDGGMSLVASWPAMSLWKID